MSNVAWYCETEDQLTAEISKLTSFQTFMGVETYDDPIAHAAKRVIPEVVEREPETGEYLLPHQIENLRPFCLISTDPSVIRGADYGLIYQGEILILMEIEKRQVANRLGFNTPKEAEIIRYVKNQCGLIITDLFNAWPVLNRSLELSWRSSRNELAGDTPHCRFFMKFSFGPEE